jgi:pyruvate-formate lyase-activating enzyme
MFYNPMEPRELTEEQLGLVSEFRKDAKEARKSFELARAKASRHQDFLDFVEFALDQFEVMGDLVECRHLLAKNDSESRRKFQTLLKKVSASLTRLHKRYQELWHRSRKPKGLKPNNRNFEKLKGSIENLLII